MIYLLKYVLVIVVCSIPGKGEQKDKTKQDNILVVPDPSANGHNAMIKYCKGSNSVKTYSTSVSACLTISR